MSRKLNYPPKPWKDGQIAKLQAGIDFAYSISLKKWVPITPGYVSTAQVEKAFGVTTAEEVVALLDQRTASIDSEIKRSGRIWKTDSKPDNPHNNDIWYEVLSGNMYSYNAEADTWVEINYA